ncbi:MAG: hypothetical protein WC763_06760 [Candidatus Paceibacterota bacterium]
MDLEVARQSDLHLAPIHVDAEGTAITPPYTSAQHKPVHNGYH